jgi:hypothetical protein
VPPTFPGLIDSVKGGIQTGGGSHLFDIAFLLGVSLRLVKLLIPT